MEQFTCKEEYIVSIANIVKEHIDFEKHITFLDIKSFVEEIGGSVSFASNESIYPVNIEKTDASFVLKVKDSLDEYEKIILSLIEIGHLFLHLKYLDREYYSQFWIDDTAYFRYGRAVERSEASKLAHVVYNG